jgi:hypothetical protein
MKEQGSLTYSLVVQTTKQEEEKRHKIISPFYARNGVMTR